ncbi:unnamed protein product [Polarella glacialis]|uniref:Uncharacterized protein n=1 Tax=Polarella glacialis TaxID=89957 RepID=A0A813JF05_POLGL|nr:unnamed protein product [Polarella glacialis]
MAAVAAPPPQRPALPTASRMTPLEVDAQLQVAELMFRNLLAGKRVTVEPHQEKDDWYKKNLGEDWVEKNRLQRLEVTRQMEESGENSPMWIEALANANDISYEVLEAADGHGGAVASSHSYGRSPGELLRLRERGDVSEAELLRRRREILEQFRALEPKVRISYYARCGAGDQLGGLRACVAVLRLFVQDAEVLGACAKCLRLMITDHDYNRDGLAALWLGRLQPKVARSEGEDSGEEDKGGWSFLRAALDAFATQAGAEPFVAGQAEGQKAEGLSERRDEVALQIAECVVAARAAPAMQAQLALLRREASAVSSPSTALASSAEHSELREMLPSVRQMAHQLMEKGSDRRVLLGELLEMLGTDAGE